MISRDNGRDLKLYAEGFRAMRFERVQERLRRDVLLTLIRDLNAPRVLEAGCGYTSLLSDLGPRRMRTIIEPIEEHLRAALSSLDESVEGVHATLEEASINRRSQFDLVILSSVLHEAIDRQQMLRAAHECLDQGGYLALATTNPRSIHRILGVEMGLLESVGDQTDAEKSLQQHRALAMDELCGLLKDCGFRVLASRTAIPKLLSHRQMDEAIEAGAIDEQFVQRLAALSPWLPEFGSELFVLAQRT